MTNQQKPATTAPADPQAEYETLLDRAERGQLHPADFQRLEQLRPYVGEAAR